MSDTIRFPLACLLAAACALTACGRETEQASESPPAIISGTSEAVSPQTTAAKPATQAPADPVERRFSGAALDAIRQRSQPAQRWVVEAVHKRAVANAEPEDCKHASEPEATRLIDLDDDGSAEVLSFYALSGCTGGGVIQVLSVLRQDDTGAWATALETALTVRPGEQRAVLDIGHGTITLAGTDDGFGGLTEPEVIAIPPATESANEADAAGEGAMP
jgi:hypothetical protein